MVAIWSIIERNSSTWTDPLQRRGCDSAFRKESFIQPTADERLQFP